MTGRSVHPMKNDLSIRGGSNLRYIRRLRGMSAEDLSASMVQRFGEEVSPSAIMKYESGDRPITQALTARFAACLGCSTAALMDGLDLNQPQSAEPQELRMLSRDSHETFHWASTEWKGDADALITSFGLYAATPGQYRRNALMELLVQIDKAIQAGDLAWEDIPESVRRGLPHVKQLLGGLYDK